MSPRQSIFVSFFSVESLYYGHCWDNLMCILIKGGTLTLRIIEYSQCVAGTNYGVLIKGNIFTLGHFSVYIYCYSRTNYSVLIKGGVFISGMAIVGGGFHCECV